MEDLEDDFGDLYANVEVQGSSDFNCVPDCARLCPKPEEDSDGGNSNASASPPGSKQGFDSAPNKPSSSGSDSTLKVSCLEENEGSDSEDDLNIVLNDEDCQQSDKFLVSAKARGSIKNDKDGDGDDEYCYDHDHHHDAVMAGMEFKVLWVC